MREIKFRVYDPESKRLAHFASSWICGEYQSLAFKITDPADEEKGHYYLNDLDSDDYLIEQCIGLKDVRKKDIYDGDIVTYSTQFELGNQEIIAIVEWINDLSAYYLVSATANLLHSIGHDVVEIIGNVHENPELLK